MTLSLIPRVGLFNRLLPLDSVGLLLLKCCLEENKPKLAEQRNEGQRSHCRRERREP